MADCDGDPEENLLQKHKKEKKELQSQIQKLKHSVSKGEKKKKKEITEQIAQLEADLDKKHEQELKELQEGETKTELGTVSDVNDSMGHLTIDHDDGDTGGLATKEVKAKKPSKAQKRRDKKAALESEREARIQEQEIENLTSSRHLEAVQIKTVLAHRGLQIHEIPSDGNCLYAAIIHQMKLRDMVGTTEKLRQQVAQYMRDHEDSFIPFLTKDNGDAYTHEDFLEYCDLVADTPAWGGQLEIRALSTVLETPVEVIQSEGPPIVSGEEFPAKPFILTYYRHAYGLGEHYHSVEDRVEEEEDEFT